MTSHAYKTVSHTGHDGTLIMPIFCDRATSCTPQSGWCHRRDWGIPDATLRPCARHGLSQGEPDRQVILPTAVNKGKSEPLGATSVVQLDAYEAAL